MKNILAVILLMSLFASCKSQQLPITQTENYDQQNAADDSVLNVLRQTNNLVFVFAEEKFSWSRSSAYYILAHHKNKWTAILYGKKNTVRPGSGLPQTPVSYDSFAVSQSSCDSIFQYFKAHEIWKIKGEDPQHGANCSAAINDAENWRIIIFTQKNYTDAGYFAPEFYQQHCPDADRQTFIEAAKKIQTLIDNAIEK
jgi:hypothetical protein